MFNIFSNSYKQNKERTLSLFQEELKQHHEITEKTFSKYTQKNDTTFWAQLLIYPSLYRLTANANLTLPLTKKIMPVSIAIILCFTCGILATSIASKIFSIYFLPLVFISTFFIPIFYLQKLAQKRAMLFLSDYPSVLLAVASYMKSGLSLYSALEKSVRLLPETNLVTIEVQMLLKKIASGVPKQNAIEQFAERINLPELDLFRRALFLITENGGKFAPTLYRLALISKDRANLMKSAKTSTSSMKMTANVLLVLAPILVLFIAVRTNDFWDLLLYNPTANTIFSIGVMLIIFNYILLRSMSNFKA